MKTEKEIKRKIKDLRFRRLQKLYKKRLTQKPENCVYNFRQTLGDNSTIGLCLYDEEKGINNCEWQGTICEHNEDAQNCPYYRCNTTKKQIAIQLNDDLAEEETCKIKYKEIYYLKWVLESKAKIPFFKKLFRTLFKRSD